MKKLYLLLATASAVMVMAGCQSAPVKETQTVVAPAATTEPVKNEKNNPSKAAPVKTVPAKK